MATYSGNLAWRIPWTEEPGRLQSMGSQRGTKIFTFQWLEPCIFITKGEGFNPWSRNKIPQAVRPGQKIKLKIIIKMKTK